MEPILKELAARTTHRGDVMVAKLDVRANDVPDTDRPFLGCMLYPKGGGEVPTVISSSLIDYRISRWPSLTESVM